jgi:hypothetical protein
MQARLRRVNEVFGQLPRRRPGRRSPLRERRRLEAPSAPEPAPPSGDSQPPSGHSTAEDIALAGIEAATNLIVLGIKVSGRAFGLVTRH